MAEHNTLTGASLHEPKGAAAASSGEVYTADGAGSGAWTEIAIAGQSAAAADEIPKSDGAGSVTWVENKVLTTSILNRSETIDQNPSTTDTPLQITFGAAHNTTEFDISAAGAITCNVTGSYIIRFNFRFARTSGTGTAILVGRYLLDGVEAASPITCELTGAGDVVPYSVSVPAQLTAGQVLTVELLRDSSGNDDGGLASFNPTLAGWGTVGSALVSIDKMRVG